MCADALVLLSMYLDWPQNQVSAEDVEKWLQNDIIYDDFSHFRGPKTPIFVHVYINNSKSTWNFSIP